MSDHDILNWNHPWRIEVRRHAAAKDQEFEAQCAAKGVDVHLALFNLVSTSLTWVAIANHELLSQGIDAWESDEKGTNHES